MKCCSVALLALFFCTAPATAAQTDAALRSALQHGLDAHLAARAKLEHISGISLSVSLHGSPRNINLSAGTTEYGGNVQITPEHLWQIGSITKSFTAATILQLEAEGKISIGQTIGDWLPQYPAWKRVTIRSLLNMTSGIPTYDLVPAMQRAYAKNPQRTFSAPELIAYVYPGNGHAPRASTGWHYSNTNYLLAQLIVERVTGDSYASEIDRRFLRSNIGLTSTYYSATRYPSSVLDHMASGYFFMHDAEVASLAPLLGTDVRGYSLSWSKGAGGIVSSPEDVTRWARALYTGSTLAPKQRAELLAIVSVKTGQPIEKTSARDPQGFGLGVGQFTSPQMGTGWFYTGETFGYRVVYMYFPRQDAVFAIGVNSAPDSAQDALPKLELAIYETLRKSGRLPMLR